MKHLILSVLIAGTLVSCGPSTEIVKSWQEPNASLQAAATNKTLVMAMVKDETSRRVIEDELVKRLGSSAVASYTVISDAMLKEASGEKFSDKLKQDQYKYVLLMRLADVEKETSYVPGTTSAYYGGYGRYYGYGAGMYSSPGYYTTDNTYFIECNLYDATSESILLSIQSKADNPPSIKKSSKIYTENLLNEIETLKKRYK